MRIVAASALGIALLSPVLLLAVPKHETAEKIYSINYAVADLPVWRTNLKDAPKFAPELLTAYLRSTVDPNSWKTGAEMHPVQRNASLVITQTESNHNKIFEALNLLRDADPREVREVIK
jgi:hypothetical protein